MTTDLAEKSRAVAQRGGKGITLAFLMKAMIYSANFELVPNGTAQLTLRKKIAAGDEWEGVSLEELDLTSERILSYGVNDMPPEREDLTLLLDAVAFRLGLDARHDAWASIGINPRTGREYLGRNLKAVTWPIWYTMREVAFSDT